VADPDPGIGPASGLDSARDEPAPGGAGPAGADPASPAVAGADPASQASPGADPAGATPVAERLSRARLRPASGEVPALDTPWLSVLADGSERPVSRVAALSQAAQTALRLGEVGECLAALAQQRAAAADDPVALVWALTASSTCRCVFGQLGQARADLAEARQVCHYAAPLLAEPFWQFTEIVCHWLEGNWAAAQAGAASLDTNQVSAFPSALAGTVIALRVELLRGLGLPREGRRLAGRLAAAGPAEMSAWAQAGLDADDGRPADALRRLADVCDIGTRSVYRTALPLVLHRMAETAFSCGDQDVACYAATALAGLDQAAPLNEILTALAQAYAARDPEPARRALQRAEAIGAATLAAEALTARGRIGDDPAATLAVAHAAWQRIGAPARARAVAAAMRAAGLSAPATRLTAAASVRAGTPVTLTARERSVALLVHEGRTNQQIARALDISVKTVEAYLTRLYRKTTCSSRVELAVAVTERRLQLGEKDD
jgi:DNA-binding CsgD family transcriptional regulator